MSPTIPKLGAYIGGALVCVYVGVSALLQGLFGDAQALYTPEDWITRVDARLLEADVFQKLAARMARHG